MANNQTTAKLRNLHIAPRKVRLVANLVKGMPINEALAQLTVVTARSADPIIKLIRSAASNAKNSGMRVDDLVIKSIMVDQGPMLKRILPRAQGRATPIHKKFSHVTLVLGEASTPKTNRFDLVKADKKPKKEEKRTERKAKPKQEMSSKEKSQAEQPGFFRKVFQRKAI